MSSAIEVLEAKIEKQEREIAKGRALLEDLREREKVLDAEKAHRDEDYDQLSERVAVMKDQIEKRDDRLASLQHDYTVLYNAKHGVEGEDVDEQAQKIQQAKSITPKEGLAIVEKYFTAIKRRLGGVSGDVGNDRRRLGQVTVFYAGTSEAATFRLTPTYTFAQLTRDACRFWGINPTHGTLRDQFNSLWPTEAIVGEELGEAATVPYIKLVDNAPGRVVHDPKDVNDDSRHGKRGRGRSDSDSDSVRSERSEDEVEPDEYREYRLAVQRTKDMMAKQLSPFFHGPEHSRAALKFRGFEHPGENDQTKERESLFGDCMGLLFFCAFLFALLFPLSLRLGILENSDIHRSVTDSILDQHFSAADAADGTATWYDMQSIDQFYDFVDQSLVSNLFQQQTYSGRQLPLGEQGIVRGANQLVGGVRLRQYRSKDDSCKVASRFSILQAHGCYRPYSFDRQSLAAYGPGADVEGFTWSKAFSLNTYTVVTDDAYYDRSGYAAELPNEGGKARLVLNNLRANSWLDRQSRSVVLTFNLLNINYNKYIKVELVAEFDPAGGVDTRQSTEIISLSMYDFGRTGTFTLLIVCDAFAFLYVLFAVYQDTTEGLLYGMSAFFGTLWNIIDVANAIGVIALTALRILYDTIMVVQLDPQVPHFVQVTHIVDMYHSIVTLYSAVALLSFFSVLKYLRANAALSRIYQAIAISSGILGAFFFIFAMSIAAFVMSGYFVFGAELKAFRTVLRSCQEILFMLTGSADYPGMRWADPVFAPIFFILFVFIVFFVMVNFFLAIVNDSYHTVATSITFSKDSFWSKLFTAPFTFLNKSSVRQDPKAAKKRNKKGKKVGIAKRRKK